VTDRSQQGGPGQPGPLADIIWPTLEEIREAAELWEDCDE
jgi:hypothetical protein